MTAVRVSPPGEPGYDVLVGDAWADPLRESLTGASRVAVVRPPSVARLARAVGAVFDDRVVCELEIPDGETAKSLDVAAGLWDSLGQAGFTRTDAVIGVGGGATTDLAGFVASTWLRGVRVAHVATTTAGMVDAAIGGKTAVNTTTGKNLVGAFHSPSLVVCDLDALATLPIEHHRAGLAEVVKTGFIADEQILAGIEADADAALTPTSPLVRELVERSVRVKAEVVSDDLREAGRREILNYGHTLGHAIERRERYQVRHGDAVAIGMVFAARLSRAAGLLDEATETRHRDILQSLGLPTSYSGDRDELLAAMRVDKKTRADVLRFVVLTRVGKPRILENPDPAWLDAAFAAVGS